MIMKENDGRCKKIFLLNCCSFKQINYTRGNLYVHGSTVISDSIYLDRE